MAASPSIAPLPGAFRRCDGRSFTPCLGAGAVQLGGGAAAGKDAAHDGLADVENLGGLHLDGSARDLPLPIDLAVLILVEATQLGTALLLGVDQQVKQPPATPSLLPPQQLDDGDAAVVHCHDVLSTGQLAIDRHHGIGAVKAAYAAIVDGRGTIYEAGADGLGLLVVTGQKIAMLQLLDGLDVFQGLETLFQRCSHGASL